MEQFKYLYLIKQNWRKGNYRKFVLKAHEEYIYCLQFDSDKIISGFFFFFPTNISFVVLFFFKKKKLELSVIDHFFYFIFIFSIRVKR